MGKVDNKLTTHQPDDQELIKQARSGNREAFQWLIRRWETNVLNLAYRIMGDRELALDIRQVVFLRLCNRLDSFEGRSSFSTWIYRMVVNACQDELRSLQSRGRVMTKYQQHMNLTSSRKADDPEKKRLSQDVVEAVMSLPVAQRFAVILRHYHGQSFVQMSEILDVPATTLKSRTLTGLREIRNQLGIKMPLRDSL